MLSLLILVGVEQSRILTLYGCVSIASRAKTSSIPFRFFQLVHSSECCIMRGKKYSLTDSLAFLKYEILVCRVCQNSEHRPAVVSVNYSAKRNIAFCSQSAVTQQQKKVSHTKTTETRKQKTSIVDRVVSLIVCFAGESLYKQCCVANFLNIKNFFHSVHCIHSSVHSVHHHSPPISQFFRRAKKTLLTILLLWFKLRKCNLLYQLCFRINLGYQFGKIEKGQTLDLILNFNFYVYS